MINRECASGSCEWWTVFDVNYLFSKGEMNINDESYKKTFNHDSLSISLVLITIIVSPQKPIKTRIKINKMVTR